MTLASANITLTEKESHRVLSQTAINHKLFSYPLFVSTYVGHTPRQIQIQQAWYSYSRAKRDGHRNLELKPELGLDFLQMTFPCRLSLHSSPVGGEWRRGKTESEIKFSLLPGKGSIRSGAELSESSFQFLSRKQ